MTDNIVDSLVEIPNKISCHASQVSATLNLQIEGFLIRMIVALLIDGEDWLTNGGSLKVEPTDRDLV